MATAERDMNDLQVTRQRGELSAAANVAQLFRLRLQEDATRVAAVVKRGGQWRDVSWGQMGEQVEELAWGLLSLGIQRGEMVALIGGTRLEWTLSDLAIAYVGAVSVPIYHSNTAEEIQFILHNCGAVAAFIENPAQLEKLSRIRSKLPQLRHVMLMEGAAPQPSDGWAVSAAQLTEKGREVKARTPGELAGRIQAPARSEISTVLYTSGTTGSPKGVLLTNDTLIFGAEVAVGTRLLSRSDRHLMFLPFAHSFAQILKSTWFGSGMQMIFAESVEKLADNAGETHPTVLAAVPRVYEKAYGKIIADGSAQPGLKGTLFRMAMREFELYCKAKERGERYDSVLFAVARKLVFPKVRQKLSARFGGQINEFVSGGAPLSRKIAYFFDLLGFHMLEGYGLTETFACTSVNLPGQNKLGTVGRPFPGVEVKIAADGEILERGRNIMRGYLGMPQETADVIDAEGWFHTGDIGEIDADGYLRITDRKKDLIKTSGGKYIAPQALENGLKGASELVSQVVVIGDRRKYVSVLITVAEEPAKKLAAAAGEPAGTYAEAAAARCVREAVQGVIDKLNATLPSYETIKRFTILPRDFSQDAGELTPTLKVKRKFCTQKYQPQIDAMYDGESAD